MCGIVGYVGSQRAAPILLDGLGKLEYRGYDSAGVAVIDDQRLAIVRTSGKVSKLREAVEQRTLRGSTGIGHTRWATHGRPSEVNAHPHAAGPVAIVHNGIIENASALRAELAAGGAVFLSDTDSEVVAHLIRRELEGGAGSLFKATRRALKRVTGTYAIAAVSRDEPRVVVAARSGSPLVIGVGDGEMLCGSDVPALIARTRHVVFLEDGDVAELEPESYCIVRLDGVKVERRGRRVDWSRAEAERGGYKHFMLKEIHEQPGAIEDTLRGRVDLAAGDVHAGEVGVAPELAASLRRVYFVACGTSYHAAMLGRHWIERIAGVPAVVELASEVRHRAPIFFPDDLVVAVSQSGETVDTFFAAKAAKEAGATVLAVCNVVDSAIPRLAQGALYTRAGPEIGVASTKCFTAQMAALLLLSVYLGRRRGTLPREEAQALLQALLELPQHMHRVLDDAEYVRSLAKLLQPARDVLFLGRGLGFPVALEGALKLKEVSYAHAEGAAAGEMRHGPTALIHDGLPVVMIATQGGDHDRMLDGMAEVRGRDGRVIALATRGDESILEVADDVVWLPEVPEEVQPFLTVLPLQLVAYYVATLKGNDVDQPRNLAKTVTVE
jgi:glucosamine--fructose-6-phosphate aminotransferase (isomerizing)